MLDHIFISVSDIKRSIRFYTAALTPLGITARLDYDGKNGPAGHPDLKGFGVDGRIFFWLREGVVEGRAVHVGFVANSKAQVDAAYTAAMANGVIDNGAPGARLHYDPNYYAAGVLDPDGYSVEFVYKNWQHGADLMTQQKDKMLRSANALIDATNAFNVDHSLTLFALDAVIDDPSTGHRFDGHAGIRDYIEQYFIGYNTVTRILSIQSLGENLARVRVDFTGDFGHEIGLLDISIDADGLIARIDASLE